MKYEPRTCIICKREYIPRRIDQRSCGNPACVDEVIKIAQREYREKNYAKVLEQNRESMKRRKEEQIRAENMSKKDTIVAIGYAERQIAESLKMAGKINTEL